MPEEAGFLMPYLRGRRLLDHSSLSLSERRALVRYLLCNGQFQKWRMPEGTLTPILERDLSLREVIAHLYAAFAAAHGKPICGDKTPPFIRKLPLLLEAWPGARLVHIVRDGRDVYLSLKQRHHPTARSVAVASFEWRVKLLLIRRVVRRLGDRAMELRYEDLLDDPVAILWRVCAFLEVPFEQGMLEFWTRSEEFIDRQHSELIFRPVDSSNKERWRSELEPGEVRRYEFFSRRQLEAYAYPVTVGRVGPLQKLVFLAEFAVYLPVRVLRMVTIALLMRVASRFGLGYDHEKWGR